MAPNKATAELVNALAGPRVDSVANSGHMVPLEAPNKCRNFLKEFIFSNNPAS